MPRSSATDPSLPQSTASSKAHDVGRMLMGLQKVMFQGSGVLDTWMTVPGSVRPETS